MKLHVLDTMPLTLRISPSGSDARRRLNTGRQSASVASNRSSRPFAAARAARSRYARAIGPLLAVTTCMPAPSASRICVSAGSPVRGSSVVISTRLSAGRSRIGGSARLGRSRPRNARIRSTTEGGSLDRSPAPVPRLSRIPRFVLVPRSGTPSAVGTCTLSFLTETATWLLLLDCTTDTAIQVPDGITLDGNGHKITAVEPGIGHFTGAVVQNATAQSTIHVTNLTVDATLPGNPCDAGEQRLRGILFFGASGTATNN